MDHERDEPLIEGLDHLAPGTFDEPEEAPELFERILGQTTAVVRRRRRLRAALAVAAAILLFVAGAATDRLLTRPDAPVRGVPEVRVAEAPRTGDAPLPTDPRDLEGRLAKSGPEDRARTLRRAGDGYLSGENADPQAALYCYRRLLDDPDVTAAPGEDDSWLLLYLKLAREPE